MKRIVPARPTLYALVALICGLASATAGAQSEEYRRGYEQGYRDGAEAQSRADRGGPAGHIIIEEAHYGVRGGGFCDARGAVQQMVGWRRHFDVPVGNNLCGDPAVGMPKFLFLRYRCGDSQSARAEAPENSVLQLNCQ
jgi:hypothetical protein